MTEEETRQVELTNDASVAKT
ncbi:unnamed protein product, partial [Brachionus calyciflorus]